MAVFVLLLCIQCFNMIIGAASLGMGVVILLSGDPVVNALGHAPLVDTHPSQLEGGPSFLDLSAYCLIGIGLITLMVVLAGCCAALEKSKTVLYIFSIFAFFVLLAGVGGLIFVHITKNGIEDKLHGFLNQTIADYNGIEWSGNASYLKGESDKPFSKAWDAAMVQFKCCGLNSIDDFQAASKWKKRFNVSNNGAIVDVTAKVPVTCCKMKNPTAYPAKLALIEFEDIMGCVKSKSKSGTHDETCYKHLKSKVVKYITPIYLLTMAVSFFELLGLFSALCLIKCITTEEEKRRYEKREAFQMLGMMNPMNMLYTPSRYPEPFY